MAPNVKDGNVSPGLPGGDETLMTANRDIERPVWTSNGTLMRRQPVRHYIPKHPFYYTSTELFECKNKTRQEYEEQTKKFVASMVLSHPEAGDARRAFSAPGTKRKSSKLPPLSREGESRQRPSTMNRQRIRPETVPWVITPVPGMRTIPEYDLYRRDALDQKNNLYHIDSGLLPKYMGYVPGLKFRYGSTFGMLTYNAKEIGVGRSATWGGAVSLF